jgi:hypothetical protein
MENKDKRKLGKCTCHNCGIEFEKTLSELNRNEKLGRRNFCSLNCVGHSNTEKLMKYQSDYDISKHSNNLRDEFTGLREFIRRAKKRNIDCDIDLVFLKELWDKQNICIYTGVQLVLPKNRGANSLLNTASLDRIDSNLGYLKNNVQFISITANYAKNKLTHEEMINFCDLITNNRKPSPMEVRVY